MPSKLQLKTLSNSGELLNVINCAAGRISVFRGNTPADLRPYQRALVGTSSKEKMIVAVDGADYNPETQNIIGLGEAPPHAGLTVRDFLGKTGVRDAALEGLLNSFGLESTADMRVSALSPDQERRVRILLAVAQPEKALIINEPFELITSQWKERFAEVLLDFARLKNGLVIIPSLSYRPESWIDNSLIARIEVGQSIQRTIGFGQAGSEANQMMDELKRKLREDAAAEKGSRRDAAVAAGVAAGIIPGAQQTQPPPPSDYALIKSWLLGGESKAFKFATSLLAAAIGVGSALVIMDVGKTPQPPKADVVAAVQPAKPSALPAQAPTITIDKALEGNKPPQQSSVAAVSNKPQQPQKVRYLLDEYPEVIRASIIETSHGIAGEVAESEVEKLATQNAGRAKNGNLYSLLEKASSDSAAPGGSAPAQSAPQYEPEYDNSDAVDDEPVDQAEEDQKREEIRAKFLEAIRAAAERREAAMDEE